MQPPAAVLDSEVPAARLSGCPTQDWHPCVTSRPRNGEVTSSSSSQPSALITAFIKSSYWVLSYQALWGAVQCWVLGAPRQLSLEDLGSEASVPLLSGVTLGVARCLASQGHAAVRTACFPLGHSSELSPCLPGELSGTLAWPEVARNPLLLLGLKGQGLCLWSCQGSGGRSEGAQASGATWVGTRHFLWCQLLKRAT